MKKLLLFVALLAVCSCATTKKTEQSTTVSKGDSAKVEIQHQGSVSNQTVNYDSLFSVWKQRIEQQQSVNEQSHETINETITSYIDSLGREVRQEQRTIDRDLARQTEIRHQQEIDAMQQQFSQQLSQYDSLFADMEARMQTHWNDSTAKLKEKAPATCQHSFWMRIHDFITAMVNVIVFAVIIGFILRWRKK